MSRPYYVTVLSFGPCRCSGAYGTFTPSSGSILSSLTVIRCPDNSVRAFFVVGTGGEWEELEFHIWVHQISPVSVKWALLCFSHVNHLRIREISSLSKSQNLNVCPNFPQRLCIYSIFLCCTMLDCMAFSVHNMS